MAENKKLVVEIKGDSKDLQKGLNTAEKKVTTLSNKLKKMGSKIGSVFKSAGKGALIGITALTGAIGGAVAAYKVQEQAEIKTRQTIIATGKAAGLTADEIFKMASALQKQTTFGDEAIIGGQNLLLTFKNIGGDTFPRATEAMLDMSTAMGTDLKSSAIQMGKALNDPIAGMASLSRVGITFSDQQKDQIKTMQKSGDLMGAQGIILTELESQFGGMAKAAAQGTGIMTQITNSFGDIIEKFGQAAMPAITALGGELLGLVDDGNEAQDMFRTFSDVVQAFAFGLLNVKRFIQSVGVVIGSVLGTALGATMQAMEGNFAQSFETIKSSGDEFTKDMLEIDKSYQDSKKNLDKEFAKSEAERQNVAQSEALASKKEHYQQMLEADKKATELKKGKELEDHIAKLDNLKLMNEEELAIFQENQELKDEQDIIQKAMDLEKEGKHAEALSVIDDLKTKRIIKNSKDQIAQDKELAKQKALQQKTLLSGTASFMDAAGGLAKKGSIEQKALQTSSAIISTYTAANQALSSPPGPPWTIPLMAGIVATGLGNVAKINSTKMSRGGVYTGGLPGIDSIPAEVQRNEITAPVKSYDEVIEGAIQQRGYVKEDESGRAGDIDININMNENLIDFIEAEVIKRRAIGIDTL